MQRTFKKFVLLLVLICTVLCCVAFAACQPKDDGGNDGPGGDGGNEQTTVTYSVTVTTDDEDLDLTTLTAQWKSGTEVKGSKALAADGKASVELVSGNYTVTLNGTPDGYTFTDATVTAAKRDAAIEVKKPAEPSVERTLTLTITNNTGLTLPAGVKVQVYDENDEAYGAPQAVQQGVNSITVLRTDCSIELVDLPAYLGSDKVQVAATDYVKTLSVYAQDLDYTVTVEAETGVDLEGVTVTFYNAGAEVEGATELELDENNTVSALLPAGEYTADLNNINPAYEYDVAALSYTSPEATISITITKYTVTIDADAVNLTSVNVEGLTVNLVGSNGTFSGTIENGVAVIEAPKGDYTVAIVGLGNNYGITYGALTETNRTTTVYIAEALNGTKYYYTDTLSDLIPVGSAVNNLNKDGRFVVTATAYQRNYIEFIPGMQVTPWVNGATYEITWKDSNVIFKNPNNIDVKESAQGYVRLVLSESVEFAFQYNDGATHTVGETYKFLVEIAQTGAPEQGTRDNPIEIVDMIGTHDEAGELTEVYFLLPENGYSENTRTWYQIVFSGDYTVYFYETGELNYYVELSGVEGENNYFQPWHMDGDNPSYRSILYIKSNDGSPIVFEIKGYTPPAAAGSSPDDPISLMLDYPYEQHFQSDTNQTSPWYYTYTPSETGVYEFVVSVFTYGRIVVYSGYPSGSNTRATITAATANKTVNLDAGATYYIEFGVTSGISNEGAGLDVGFKLTKYVARPGTASSPLETHVGINEAVITNPNDEMELLYYMTFTAPSNGTFTFRYTTSANSAYTYFCRTSAFDWDREYSSTYFYAQMYLGSGTTSFALNAGQTVYMVIYTLNTQTVQFSIGGFDTEEYELTVGTSADVKVKENGTIEIDLVNVPAGRYSLVYTLDDATTANLTFDADGSSVKVDGVTGSGVIEIQSGTTKIVLTVADFNSSSTLTVTVSLEEYYALSVGNNVRLTLSGGYNTSISASVLLENVEAGDYTLKITGSGNHASSYGAGLIVRVGTQSFTIGHGESYTNSYSITITNAITSITFSCANWTSGDVTLTLELVARDAVVEEGLEVGGSWSTTLNLGGGDGGATYEIPLKGVSAGSHTFRWECSFTFSYFELEVIPQGGSAVNMNDKYQSTITIPANCTFLTFKLKMSNGYGQNGVNFTFYID